MIVSRACACDVALHNLPQAGEFVELGGRLLLRACRGAALPAGRVWVADWALAALEGPLRTSARLLERPSKRDRRARLQVTVDGAQLARLREAVVLRCLSRQMRPFAGAARVGHVLGVSVAGAVVVARVAAVDPSPDGFAVSLMAEAPQWTPLERALEECFAPLLLPRLAQQLAQPALAGRLVAVAGRGARLDSALLLLLAHRLALRPLLVEARTVDADAGPVPAGTLVVVAGAEELREDETQPLRAWLERLLPARRQLAVLWTPALALLPADLRSGCVAVALPSPSRPQRAVLLEALREQLALPLPPDAETVDSTGGFAVEDLERLAAAVASRGGDWAAARATVRPRLLLEAGWDAPTASWEAVAGCAHVRAALERAIVWPLRHPELLAQFDCAPAGGTLLYGPPGCGKSLCVAAFAASSRINLLQATAAQVCRGVIILHLLSLLNCKKVLSKYTGETEAQIRQLFAHCRSLAPCVLCLDDFDQLAASREAEESGEDTGGAAQRAVSTLLNELDGVDTAAGSTGVFLVALCNRPWALDAAILRPGRLDTFVYVGPPDAAARRALLGPQREALVEETEGFSHAAVLARARGSRAVRRIDPALLAKYAAFAL